MDLVLFPAATPKNSLSLLKVLECRCAFVSMVLNFRFRDHYVALINFRGPHAK